MGGYFVPKEGRGNTKWCFFILALIPVLVCLSGMGLSKEIDQYKINEMVSFKK